MTYSLIITRKAQKQLAALPKNDYLRAKEKIENLAQQPRPAGAIKLTGRDAWRIRVGNYRIIYEIFDDQLIVKIIRVRHRKDAYD